ncbi:TerC family protein [Priestia taiwanensis]|uniref:Membrane protein n=1 Tax=Priestia taiwanensis TaxID=1347902 RepID=A0A917AMS2_9BACI|nr:TerC family protein [Priestia taiwanensis]MBM7362450.1 YjbE family integral membrane protein [Priestia taiwanensis]GGE62315.1 membrane protein [Priestia taiwanensis]
MDFFTADFWSALLSIVVIDLVLAGDNAIVIGLAARNLPKDQQKKVIFWGTAGAIIIRALLTLAVTWLLKIPGLLLVGGILLVWIAYKLLVDEKEHGDVKSDSLWTAVKTIIIADTVMGLDNVLAIAGASHGSFLLVVLGLLISIPIVVWGSTLILKLIDRYPIIIYIGSAVLAWTASKMIVDEPFLQAFFLNNPMLKWGLTIVLVVGVLLLGRMHSQRKPT